MFLVVLLRPRNLQHYHSMTLSSVPIYGIDEGGIIDAATNNTVFLIYCLNDIALLAPRRPALHPKAPVIFPLVASTTVVLPTTH